MERPIHVLHVDDEADFGEMVSTFLPREDDRIEVHTATSAEEGLELLADHDIDCIVSDYDMPKNDGIAFLERIRESHPRVPFLLYTGKGSEEIASEAISAGVTDYLQKKAGTDQYAILANRIANAVDQARSERAVEHTREYFSTILEQASDYVMIVGEDGQVGYISPAVERVMGYSPDELAESDAFEYTHPDDKTKAATAFIEVFENPTIENTVEFRARHADGSWRWLEVRGRNLLDDPVIDGVMVNVRDITERKEREKKLKRYEYAYASSLSGIAIASLDGEITNVNPAILEMWGFDEKEDVLGRLVTEVWEHPEKAATVLDKIKERGSWEGELEAIRADGSTFYARGAASLLTNEDDEPIGLMASFIDITERLEHERELERQNKRLDEFASVLSHDLRNPLNVAQGRLELAQAEFDSDHFEPIERAHERMESLIEDLLMLAREGKAVTDLESVDLSAVLNRCKENAETRDASIVIDTDRSIRADESRLQQVFENLFRNAVEHGGDDVTVTVGALDDGFYVEDDGTGIPAGDRDEIFEPGYSTTEAGTGFGLSIVKEIVEAHDWDISVVEGADGGARFEITGVSFVAE